MKATLFDLEGNKKSEIDLPSQFNEEVREDLIKRAVLALQSQRRTPYGVNPEAGKRASVWMTKRRHRYRGVYGHGISRMPKKVMSQRGNQFNWTGAFAPGTVGGRKAHPPKVEKIHIEKINKKERQKAIRSAISASALKELVVSRGHKVPEVYPIIVEDKFETLEKTKVVVDVLKKLKLEAELNRCTKKKVRAGKGKMRSRKYKKRRGPLIVVSNKCKLEQCKNLPGVDIIHAKSLNAELLAPGAVHGRLTIWTKAAVEKVGKERMFC